MQIASGSMRRKKICLEPLHPSPVSLIGTQGRQIAELLRPSDNIFPLWVEGALSKLLRKPETRASKYLWLYASASETCRPQTVIRLWSVWRRTYDFRTQWWSEPLPANPQWFRFFDRTVKHSAAFVLLTLSAPLRSVKEGLRKVWEKYE